MNIFMSLFVLVYAGVLFGCLISLSATAKDISVYAAASLTDAITKVSQVYEASHPNLKVQKSFGGSSILAKQIEQGAPADVFISADVDWVNYLDERHLVRKESKVLLLSNELVLIAPSSKTPKPVVFDSKSPLEKKFSGKLCTGDPASVPVGKYAKQALGYYGWWDAIKPRIVATDDVRTALAFVERGECDLGIVYKTDAVASKKVDIVGRFPAASYSPIVYPLVLTKGATTAANDYWQFLQNTEAARVFREFGFTKYVH